MRNTGQSGYRSSAVAENALSVIAEMIGSADGIKRKIRVDWHNGRAIDANIFTGVIRVPREATASGLSNSALNLMRGHVYHEAGHIYRTGYDRNGSMMTEKDFPKGSLQSIWNAVEDRWMEREVRRISLGASKILPSNNRYYNKKIAGQISDGLNSPLWEALCWMGFLSDGINPAWTPTEKAQKYIDATCELFVKWKDCTCSIDCLNLAKEIHEKIKEENQQQSQQQEQQEESNDDSESGEDDSEGNSSEDSESDSSDDSENDSNDYGESDEENGDDNSSNSSESSEDESEENSEDDDGSGDNSQENSQEKSDNNTQGEGKESGDDDDDSDSSDAGNGDSTDSSGNEGEDEGEESSNQSGDPRGDQNEIANDESTLTEEQLEAILREELEDGEEFFENILSEIIEEEIENITESGDIVYLSRKDLDQHLIPSSDRKLYKEIHKSVSAGTGCLSRNLEQALRTRAKTRRLRGRRQGRLDGGKLVQIGKGLSRNVFYKQIDGIEIDTAVVINVDLSGSMSCEVGQARDAVISLGEALERLKIPLMVVGSTTKYSAYSVSGNMDGFSRTNPIMYHHFKDFSETWHQSSGKIATMGRQSMMHHVDGETIEYAYHQLAARSESRKIIISICDGMPNAGHGNGLVMAKNLEMVCKRVRKAGVEVYGFGINTIRPKQYYGEDFFMNIAGKIDSKFASGFSKILFKSGMR